MLRLGVLAGVILALAAQWGCASVPPGLKPVTGFQADRYLGTWYEIARLNHPFERGLSQVTAVYSKRDDGRIQVINRGYNARQGKWREARGVAEFANSRNVGSLMVTFVWPFSGAYHVLVLDSEYNYAMVTSSNRSYLWILAREKRVDAAVLNDLLAKAKAWGFRTEALLFVAHDALTAPTTVTN